MGFSRDYFKTPSLMAAKKLGRNLCAKRQKLTGCNRREAGRWAAAEIHRRLPQLIDVWQKVNNEPWKGDDWFAKRIDHQSEDNDNKASHVRLNQFIAEASASGLVYTWVQWSSLVAASADDDARLMHYLYLMPFSSDYGRLRYDIQKIGVTTSLTNRLREYHSKGPRGIAVTDVCLWPADYWVLTCSLGRVRHYEARVVENDCVMAIGGGGPSKYGYEWFETDTVMAISAVMKVLRSRGLEPQTRFVVARIGGG